MISDIGLAALIAAIARRDLQRQPSALARPVFIKLGQVSFAFYLVHLLTIQLVASAWPDDHPHLPLVPGLGLALLSFACALGVAFALHHFVELKAQRFLMSRLRVRQDIRSGLLNDARTSEANAQVPPPR
jgi:peptidoglycan/LPS O-acetylase OafA/YrhL